MQLARLSDRPVTLLTLQAAKVLEGMLQRGFTTVRDAGGADGGLAEAVEQGLGFAAHAFSRRAASDRSLGIDACIQYPIIEPLPAV
jgi:hypothetical protein